MCYISAEFPFQGLCLIFELNNSGWVQEVKDYGAWHLLFLSNIWGVLFTHPLVPCFGGIPSTILINYSVLCEECTISRVLYYCVS
jgi:hypothetical protein